MDSRDEPKRAGKSIDPWSALGRFTPARIAQGRAGGSWRTETLLDFRLSHAGARDAVCRAFDIDKLDRQIQSLGQETARVTTRARSKDEFLKRPDLGRQLSSESLELIKRFASEWSRKDLLIAVSDGLSALAAEKQAAPVLSALLPALKSAGWRICPIFIVPRARVKLQDALGNLLCPRQSLALVGERPGLGSPDSLGAYFTWNPGPGKTDADRNCVSNIRPGGFAPADAGLHLATLLIESARQQKSGVNFRALPKIM